MRQWLACRLWPLRPSLLWLKRLGTKQWTAQGQAASKRVCQSEHVCLSLQEGVCVSILHKKPRGFFFFFCLNVPSLYQWLYVSACPQMESEGLRVVRVCGPSACWGWGCPYSTLSSFRVLWALAGEGTLTLLTALAADQGSGTGMAFSPG